MDNSFFIMSEAHDGNSPVTIKRLQICSWNIISGDACLELGIEIEPGTLQLNHDYSVVFFADWLTKDCSIISLHDKFTEHDNVRFVFNETAFSSSPIDGYAHNGSRIVLNGNSHRILAILPAKAILADGELNLSFKNKAQENESPYLRVLIKSKLKTFAMIKNGIAKNTYVFDVKVNERRNLPKRFLNTVNSRNLTYCLIENVFCLHAVPTSFEISFIDGTKLKNIRQLEKKALETYLPEVKPNAKEDYIIIFSKCSDKSKSSYSFFCIFSRETIGTPQILLAITANIICCLLFAFGDVRLHWNSQLSWYRQIPAEYLIAFFFLVLIVIRSLYKENKTK